MSTNQILFALAYVAGWLLAGASFVFGMRFLGPRATGGGSRRVVGSVLVLGASCAAVILVVYAPTLYGVLAGYG